MRDEFPNTDEHEDEDDLGFLADSLESEEDSEEEEDPEEDDEDYEED